MYLQWVEQHPLEETQGILSAIVFMEEWDSFIILEGPTVLETALEHRRDFGPFNTVEVLKILKNWR